MHPDDELAQADAVQAHLQNDALNKQWMTNTVATLLQQAERIDSLERENADLWDTLKNCLERMEENPPPKAKRHNLESVYREAVFYRDRQTARDLVDKYEEPLR